MSTPVLPSLPVAQTSLPLLTALWPDETAQKAMAACRDALNLPAAARPVATQRLHMALHAIDGCHGDLLGELCRALPPIRRGFEIRLTGVERWPQGELVLCPDQDLPELRDLHARQAEVLQSMGLAGGLQDFRPHVVLARGCRGSVRLRAVEMRWRVRGYALIRACADGRFEAVQQYTWA
jgi:2'-5' RNA ligase